LAALTITSDRPQNNAPPQYVPVANAEVSGAGTASAGLPG